ncbi:MAG TPA: hypothetical protein VLX91_17215 [Candidatus Acidoferrales bacterium]|nr:hypothetical protein [Candidatus Acidoferrales bacterium]
MTDLILGELKTYSQLPPDLLEVSGSWNSMVTHRVSIINQIAKASYDRT